MGKLAVIKTGGKQYVVGVGDEITVDHLKQEDKAKVELETLATINQEEGTIEVGTPTLSKSVTAEVVTSGKGEKLRVARFRSKVRYRKVKGFRPSLTTLKIIKI